MTHEQICNLHIKSNYEILKDNHMKKANGIKNILDNTNFRKAVFCTMLMTTLIINLGYIVPRESSKAD